MTGTFLSQCCERLEPLVMLALCCDLVSLRCVGWKNLDALRMKRSAFAGLASQTYRNLQRAHLARTHPAPLHNRRASVYGDI